MEANRHCYFNVSQVILEVENKKMKSIVAWPFKCVNLANKQNWAALQARNKLRSYALLKKASGVVCSLLRSSKEQSFP